jgi:hypothetical protein
MPPPDDLDLLSPAEVEGLVVQLWEQIIELRRLVAALRDENARLKSGAGRPNIKPNSKPGGMEQAIDSKPPGGSNERRRRSSTRAKLPAPPSGSRFKGYTSLRWLAPEGKVITAPLSGSMAISGRDCGVSCSPNIIRTNHGAAAGDTVARVWHRHLQTRGGPPVDNRPRRLSRGSARWARERGLDHGGRHGRGTRPTMASAPRSATPISRPSPLPPPRAASTFSACCAPAMTITSPMKRRSPICANVRWPLM